MDGWLDISENSKSEKWEEHFHRKITLLRGFRLWGITRKGKFFFFDFDNVLTPHKFGEIYKENSEKYKGKMRNQDISVFGPKHNFIKYLRWLAAFLRS